MEIFRFVLIVFQAFGKLILRFIYLIKRLIIGGEKTEIKEDDQLKDIFGEEVSSGGQMEQSDKMFYTAMMGTIKRVMANMDEDFLKAVDNLKEEEFDLLMKKLGTDVKSEKSERMFDKTRGDFTEEGKNFIERKLFSYLIPEDKYNLPELPGGVEYVEMKIEEDITTDEYFKNEDFIKFLIDEYGMSDKIAKKSLTKEDFDKIKMLFDNKKEKENSEETEKKSSNKEKEIPDENFATVYKESEKLKNFIWKEYGINYDIYKSLKPEELEIINKRYVNYIQDHKIFPQNKSGI